MGLRRTFFFFFFEIRSVDVTSRNTHHKRLWCVFNSTCSLNFALLISKKMHYQLAHLSMVLILAEPGEPPELHVCAYCLQPLRRAGSGINRVSYACTRTRKKRPGGREACSPLTAREWHEICDDIKNINIASVVSHIPLGWGTIQPHLNLPVLESHSLNNRSLQYVGYVFKLSTLRKLLNAASHAPFKGKTQPHSSNDNFLN